MNLRSGFSIGEWTVYPLEGRLSSEHGEFRVQPKSMDVLLCLAEHAGEAVERDTILHQVWGESAPTDEPLTRCIGELRRALGDTRAEPTYILTIPKRGYRLLQEAHPLPGSEPEPPFPGTDRSSKKEDAFETRLATGKKIALGVALILAAALTEFSIERLYENTHSSVDSSNAALQNRNVAPENSIAVLPFVNLSNEIENEYFSDGLAETLIYTLARLPNVHITARTSSFMFKDKQADVREIAEQLGVTHILEGSVQKSGNRVRVTAQLIHAADGFNVWTATYDEELNDIFEVQDEIASKTANALFGRLQNDVTEAEYTVVKTVDASAYDLYLRALAQYRIFSFDSLQLAEQHLQDALAIDSGFSEARVLLGNVYVEQAHTGMISWSDAMPGAHQQVEYLLVNDDQNPLARALQAKIDGFDAMRDFNFEGIRMATASLEEISAETPVTGWIHVWLSMLHLEVGNTNAALRSIERGLTVDPLSTSLHSKHGEVLYALGRYDESARAFEMVRQLNPTAPGGYSSGGTVARAARDYEAYVPLMLRSMEIDPVDHELPLRFAGTLYALQLVLDAEPWYQRGAELAPDAPATLRLGLDRAWLLGNYAGVRDVATEMLESKVENRLSSVFAAAMYYVHAQRELDALDEVSAFFESVSPGVTNPHARIDQSRDFWVKVALIDALFTQDPDLAREHAVFLDGYVRESFQIFVEDPRLLVLLKAAMGQRDQAIEAALTQDLSSTDIASGLSAYASEEYRFFAPLNSLMTDPEVAARIAEIDQLRIADTERVRNLLSTHAVSPP